MRIPVDQITTAIKQVDYAEAVEALNERLAVGDAGLRAETPLAVTVRCYRAGVDVVVEGTVDGDVRATCGRCLEEYPLQVAVPFRVILEPIGDEPATEPDEAREDLGLGVLRGDAVDVSAIVHEHLLLAVPTTRVCRAECLGLCLGCGANRNEATCTCPTQDGPRPRMAVLQDLLRARAHHD